MGTTMGRVAVHYYSAGAPKFACGARATRSAALTCTSDRTKFDGLRSNGRACERCCASVDKKDAIAAKYAARDAKRVLP